MMVNLKSQIAPTSLQGTHLAVNFIHFYGGYIFISVHVEIIFAYWIIKCRYIYLFCHGNGGLEENPQCNFYSERHTLYFGLKQ